MNLWREKGLAKLTTKTEKNISPHILLPHKVIFFLVIFFYNSLQCSSNIDKNNFCSFSDALPAEFPAVHDYMLCPNMLHPYFSALCIPVESDLTRPTMILACTALAKIKSVKCSRWTGVKSVLWQKIDVLILTFPPCTVLLCNVLCNVSTAK